MSRFDWIKFLREHRIEYVTSGPNFSRRNTCNIRCPFCGDADPSQHLGLAPQGWWGCLRNSAHRGKSPVRLIQQLLHCTEQEARRLAGGTEAPAPTVDEFEASYAALKVQTTLLEKDEPLHLSREFKPLLSGSIMARPFIDYFERRGFRKQQITWLAETYNLHYATRGPFAYRIIIPIYDRYGTLLSWTGRTIGADVQPRYKTLSVTPNDYYDGPLAKIAANSTILGLPLLWGAGNPRVLVLVEGPFDAFKVTAFGHSLGVYGAALFGLNVYPAQVSELLELETRFPEKYLLQDEDAELEWLRLSGALAPLRVKPWRVPAGRDDPGALSGEEVVRLALELVG